MDRIGFGFDSHRFVPGRPLRLCGITIEHDRGLAGHSDGDAAVHAVIDAMLGAAGAGDIGELFPDSDPQWKDADSAGLLVEAMNAVLAAGWAPINCDVTIVTERPRLEDKKPAMRERIAELLGLETGAVSVKAKTGEGMGLVGAGEGLAAFAVVLMEEVD